MFTDVNSDTLAAVANPVSKYIAYTLVDITDSGVITPKKNRQGFYQAQNLNTFVQVLSFRTQILDYSVRQFSDTYSDYGLHGWDTASGNIWELTFIPESTDPWIKDENKLFWLINDFMGVPVHTGLKESVKITPEIINTIATGSGKINTCFNISLNI